MDKIMAQYEIRQQVGTVVKRWLEVVSTHDSWRSAEAHYAWCVAQAPDCYFELVRVEITEDCRAHTGIPSQ